MKKIQRNNDPLPVVASGWQPFQFQELRKELYPVFFVEGPLLSSGLENPEPHYWHEGTQQHLLYRLPETVPHTHFLMKPSDRRLFTMLRSNHTFLSNVSKDLPYDVYGVATTAHYRGNKPLVMCYAKTSTPDQNPTHTINRFCKALIFKELKKSFPNEGYLRILISLFRNDNYYTETHFEYEEPEIMGELIDRNLSHLIIFCKMSRI